MGGELRAVEQEILGNRSGAADWRGVSAPELQVIVLVLFPRGISYSKEGSETGKLAIGRKEYAREGIDLEIRGDLKLMFGAFLAEETFRERGLIELSGDNLLENLIFDHDSERALILGKIGTFFGLRCKYNSPSVRADIELIDAGRVVRPLGQPSRSAVERVYLRMMVAPYADKGDRSTAIQPLDAAGGRVSGGGPHPDQ